jgi:hypothetical protein
MAARGTRFRSCLRIPAAAFHPRSRGFPRSDTRPAVDGGWTGVPLCPDPRSRGFSMFRAVHGGFREAAPGPPLTAGGRTSLSAPTPVHGGSREAVPGPPLTAGGRASLSAPVHGGFREAAPGPPLTAGGRASLSAPTPVHGGSRCSASAPWCRLKWLKPNTENPRERGSGPPPHSTTTYPSSRTGLLPLRGNPRERG